jgi:mRNA-degrading endonuclease RelE of RelBE toxin-antitoxin system
MNYTLVFNSEVEADFKEGYDWYEEQLQGLGERFEDAVEARLIKITENPEVYHFASGKYREAIVPKFPFSIIYKLNKRKRTIYISAIHHSSRDPKEKFRKQPK